MRIFTSSLCALVAVHAPLAAQDAPVQPPRSHAEAGKMATETLAQMDEDEKIALLHGKMPALLPPAKRAEGVVIGAGWVQGVPRLGIPALVETDASLGVSNLMNMRPGDHATALPSGLAMASTWNPELIREGGAMIGSEASAKGFNVMLVGGVNLVRDPRAGRNFEYLGEDPLLAGRLVGAQIAGVQSNPKMIATIKHFAVNDQETGRHVANVVMDEAALRESDLLAFQIGIEEGDPGSVMCAYNRVGGSYACENAFLLTDVLRGDWGFRGFVMSDWGAVHSTEAVLAGLDQQSGDQLDGKRWFSDELRPKLASGEIPQAALDRAAGRILSTIYRHRLDGWDERARQPIDYAANGRIAQQVAEQGIVLLRNEGGILPIAASAGKILVVGGNADKGVPSGGGSSQVAPVGGFKVFEQVSKDPMKSFARRAFGGTPPLDALRRELPSAAITYVDGSDPAAATAAATDADLVIVFADKFAAETMDHPDLSLDGEQDALIASLAGANPKIVVVLETGNPVDMPWHDQVPAILAAWYGGQEGGTAIARILTGRVNPSGHLPVTFPRSVDQLPNPKLPGSDAPKADKAARAIYGVQADLQPFDITYPEGSDAGYRWFDAKGLTPLYPFGHGLSYTSFAYGKYKVKGGKRLAVSFTVANSGEREGADVAQVYISRPGKAKRLVGWGRSDLQPGESSKVSIMADPRVIGDFDPALRKWVVPQGTYTVELARSATDIVERREVVLERLEVQP
ncbi:MAG: glycoside hydrolase family 3 C-terminal domain-containing protein [Sphingomonadaceae bacterium]|nr:glycoside hydrolase family 3 C-terminal domain-containing protein [Sphingomonadaceae bacterium]